MNTPIVKTNAASVSDAAARFHIADDQAMKLRDCFVQHQKGVQESAKHMAMSYVDSGADADRMSAKKYLENAALWGEALRLLDMARADRLP